LSGRGEEEFAIVAARRRAQGLPSRVGPAPALRRAVLGESPHVETRETDPVSGRGERMDSRTFKIAALRSMALAATIAIATTSARAQARWGVVDLGTSVGAGAHTTGAAGGPCDVPPGGAALAFVGGLAAPFGVHDMGQENTAACIEAAACVLTATG